MSMNIGLKMHLWGKKRDNPLRLANTRVRALASRVLEIQEAERRRIAHELHDEIGQALTAVQMGLHRLKRANKDELVAGIDQCTAITARALEQVRGLSINLRPPHLDDLGLEAALTWLVGQDGERTGLRKTFRAECMPDSLPPEASIACFRVAQEALTNVARHADATEVSVVLSCTESELTLSIEDNGRGFDVDDAHARTAEGASMGLLGMEERTTLAGGFLEVHSTPGRGTRVVAHVPFQPGSGLDNSRAET